jgi:GNAT superfamily N-acetyltransferase
LVVLPEYRGKGIAEALVQKCISYSRDISYKLILDAADNLHQYYTDKGFKKVGGYYRMDLE